MTSGKEGVSWEKGDTWPKVLQHNYETYGDTGTALRFKHYGIWQPCTWKDYYLNVKYLALGLLSLGFESGDKVLIVGDNAPQWIYAELAAQANHGVSVGGYADLMPREISTLAEHCEARFAIVEDQEQVDKFLQIKAELPALKKVIYWNPKGLAHYKDPLLMGFRQVLTLGETYEKDHPGLFEQKVESGRPDDVCALVYTSGTTGTAPKAAVHTFRTIRKGAESILTLDPWDEKDNVVPYRPPAWMTEQYGLIGCHLLSGCALNFAEDPQTLQRDIQETKPSIVFYSARRWESLAAKVQARMQGVDALKKLAFAWLMPLGTRRVDLTFQKKRPGRLLTILYALGDNILFGPIRSSLGLSNARICLSTEALLSPEALRFYHALNLPLKSLYGTTEGGLLTGARNEDIRPETAGPVLPGGEIKITDQGEIAYKQAGSFIGYYKDPEKTAAVVREGWFYSGDSGFIREDGHLMFVDRARDLVALPEGEKLAPQWVESRLNFSPYIQESWVLAGPNRTYVSAVIVINYNTVSQWAGQRKIAFNTFAELSQRPEVYALVRQDIDRVNRTLSPGSRIKKYCHLHREFDPDEGEMTRTRNLRRTVLEGHYRELIKAIYGDLKEAPIEARVKYQDGRTGTKKIVLTIQRVEGAAS
jgi:long-chain acyl-CoA synthetase